MSTIATLKDNKLKISNKYITGMDEDVQAIANMLSVVDPLDEDALSLGDMIGYNDEDTVRTEVARRIRRISQIVRDQRGIVDLRMTSIEPNSDRYRVGLAMTYASGVVKRGFINV